ncbi:DUF3488 and transglutaminase-like domain-containing protein [Amycolatopsis antarctica]|uniref:DUF3488 and transglutaminase-like domain-containing protein n=1 Tax=Amycolatopsis antarctica TaxID=1854586 RepID=UPI0010550FFA|nr:transglutaminase domain-containing protein [Amycolatopsis antarctica]
MSPVRALPAACVVLAAVVAGLLFAPVFGIAELLLPLGVPALAGYLAALLCSRGAAGAAWRPVAVTVAGLLAVVEVVLWPTTAAGLPTGETLRALAAGVTDSWQSTLQSTWPAQADPDLVLFVPLLVLFACVLGLELLYRVDSPLWSLLPSVLVLVLSQFYVALTAGAAVLAGIGYAAVAGTLLAASRRERPDPGRARERAQPVPLLLLVPPVVLAVACALVAGLLMPVPEARFSLKEQQLAPLDQTRVDNPLGRIAGRLATPETPVFQVRGAAGADRWPLVVLEDFDGVNWQPGTRYRRLGAELRPSPGVTVPVTRREAELVVADPAALGGPWLPSRPSPAGVSGLDPLVEERQGTLLRPGATGAADYRLTWWEPEIDSLADATLDPSAPGGLAGIGVVPDGIPQLAEQAVQGLRPTFESAVVLERWMRDNYRLATGPNLPSGHGWRQLTEFLLESRLGTSEQFAAGYVALARSRGIPARLVVGFRAPGPGEDTVRNGDALAWPEVAVKGVGWVPLDPSGTATAPGPSSGAGLAAAAARVREDLPPPQDLRDPPVAPPEEAPERADDGGGFSIPWQVPALLPVVLLLGWLIGVPALTASRSWRRRRRTGQESVVGAWAEARDRLRAHGVPVMPGMTVRDLAAVAAGRVDQATVDGLRSLGRTVDQALWANPAPPVEYSGAEAWAAVRVVRQGLARRGPRARIRAIWRPPGVRPRP